VAVWKRYAQRPLASSTNSRSGNFIAAIHRRLSNSHRLSFDELHIQRDRDLVCWDCLAPPEDDCQSYTRMVEWETSTGSNMEALQGIEAKRCGA
jgi:hypothetical protein